MIRAVVFLLVCGLGLAGCAQTTEDEDKQVKPLAGTAERDPSPADFIKLTKTACFGTCPVFDLTLYGDGRVLFHGSRYTKQAGQKIVQYGTGRFLETVADLKMHGFYELDSRYDRETCKIWATDHPSVSVEVRTANQSKSVTWYRGCRGIADRAKLERMFDALDRVLDVDRFVGTEAERQELFQGRRQR